MIARPIGGHNQRTSNPPNPPTPIGAAGFEPATSCSQSDQVGTRITAGNHVSLTGTARSALLAVGGCRGLRGRKSGKIGSNGGHLVVQSAQARTTSSLAVFCVSDDGFNTRTRRLVARRSRRPRALRLIVFRLGLLDPGSPRLDVSSSRIQESPLVRVREQYTLRPRSRFTPPVAPHEEAECPPLHR